ncbi:MAG: glycerate kinase [Oscillospiraceae bacterium]|nr:glycerate kinase [Oscillospiraceae bacterium]
MKKAILIPDSFKGTLSSAQICEIMGREIKRHFPDCAIVGIPVADGGEGSVDAFLTALGGEKIYVEVAGPYFEPMRSFYGLIDEGRTAVIEMAACAGLPLVGTRKDPSKTTTYGVGQLILDAAQRGVKKIIVGLGGSATTDAGCGAAAAIGVRFLNEAGACFVPVGGTLKDVVRIDMADAAERLKGVEIVTMCDIDNPMYGLHGAAYVFGPQKGADPAMVKFLDDGLRHLGEVIKRDLGRDLTEVPGGGAAGAMGVGMVAFFGSSLQMGIETVLDTVDFDSIVAGADAVFTGEGKIDSQSLRGKVVIGVARRAKKQNVPVIAVVGGADLDVDDAYGEGVKAIFTINRLPQDLSISSAFSDVNLGFAMDNILRMMK